MPGVWQFSDVSNSMRLLRRAGELVVRAPAKVNLFLEVLRKRPDGFHEIATLMVAVGLHDTLRFADDPAGDVRLDCGPSRLSTGPDNLIVKAALLLRERTGCTRGARIRLTKRIPMMAGLAGGSADAAATLTALNELWRLGRAPSELAAMASEIGSDIAFFFDLPAAWCTGRGEQVQPIAASRKLDLVLICPPFGCATADVYRRVRVPETPVDGKAVVVAFEAGEVERLGTLLHNRLQLAAEEVAPELGRLLEGIAKHRPVGRLMSGSGSTLIALCHDRTEARRLARALREDVGFRGCRIFVVRTA
jgi:4-diphosphocytidyl-2-C-methyl-D-erythritol kinase